uniref:Uncharacterized protein n=1 Tax=Chromera velia CCMP2878 TaxID=1169474 RepID=A0A0G4FKU7_9ALVE|eukprot:Cvel_3465.t1-p1 / transcript=Cvel_3465.t1 / gene=Cvel_3465 / organism=Chromera_velia_CCMP2878 / gene_product=hypothetical protein / transcript_product=hypothetical protein / location=Cvel_scaffold139:124774-126129(+) / protein_length=86 / sequence_SO=supercontig / SO=protein_coding / is_pseudo=false
MSLGPFAISGTTRSGRAYLNPSLPANQAVNQWFQELFEEDEEEMADNQQLQQQIANLQQQLAQSQTDLAQAQADLQTAQQQAQLQA